MTERKPLIERVLAIKDDNPQYFLVPLRRWIEAHFEELSERGAAWEKLQPVIGEEFRQLNGDPVTTKQIMEQFGKVKRARERARKRDQARPEKRVMLEGGTSTGNPLMPVLVRRKEEPK